MRKWLVPGIVAAVLLMGAVAFGYRTFKQSRPAPYWVVITLQVPSGDEQLKVIEKECREQVTGDAVILPVVRECDLAREWKLADENAEPLTVIVCWSPLPSIPVKLAEVLKGEFTSLAPPLMSMAVKAPPFPT